jgi:hypothetical protein
MLSSRDIRGSKNPPAVTAAKKLSNKEKDWNLVGVNHAPTSTRTRNGGNGRPSLITRKKQFNEPESSDAAADPETESDAEWVEGEDDEDDDDGGDLSEDEYVFPENVKATRVVLEVETLMETLEKYCRCEECGGHLKPEMKTICIATSIKLTCTLCGFIHYCKPPASATVGDPEAVSRERNTDSAVNILYVLGLISVGDGCSEAGRLLGLLGLSNHTTMEGRSFTAIEERISPYIEELTNEILHENLVAEVRATVSDPNDFYLWQQGLLGTVALSSSRYPKIMVSYDMAWQQRNSGNRYNSASGHALFVGGKTRQCLSLVIKSKVCNLCSTWEKKNDITVDPIPPHKCRKNHEGSSGSMESQACLEMTIDMFDKKLCSVHTICIDDDASTRSMLKWSNEDYMANNKTTEQPTSLITKGPNAGKPQPRPDKEDFLDTYQSPCLLLIRIIARRY